MKLSYSHILKQSHSFKTIQLGSTIVTLVLKSSKEETKNTLNNNIMNSMSAK